MTDDRRLSAIESRARALMCDDANATFHFGAGAPFDYTVIFEQEYFRVTLELDHNRFGLIAAERLLALYEPGAVVEVDECPKVVLESDVIIRRIAVRIPKDMPPGKYKLVRWEDGDE